MGAWDRRLSELAGLNFPINMLLPQAFYGQSTLTATRKLLGCYLVHQEGEERTIGRIVEAEAYLLTDPASHGFGGKTERNSVLFGPVGRVYIYFTYGMHYCFNVSTGTGAFKGGVLVRALEPIEGIPSMEARRGTDKLTNLTSGPAKLTQAMGITIALNGTPLADGPLQLWTADSFPSQPKVKQSDIVQTTRIGVTQAADRPWRFYLKSSPFVSHR